MPVYDCGDPDCGTCEAAFGPDRSKAIAAYEARAAAYATRRSPKLTPEIWHDMNEEAQRNYAERNEKLWAICREVLGWNVSGNLDEVYEFAMQKLRSGK